MKADLTRDGLDRLGRARFVYEAELQGGGLEQEFAADANEQTTARYDRRGESKTAGILHAPLPKGCMSEFRWYSRPQQDAPRRMAAWTEHGAELERLRFQSVGEVLRDSGAEPLQAEFCAPLVGRGASER